MLIEFVGSSGAGKTTLLGSVLAELHRRGQQATASKVLIARRTGTAWIKSEVMRNILLNFLLLPWIVRSFKGSARFYLFGLRLIWRDAYSLLDLISRLRAFLRQMGGDALLKREDQGARQVILVDEGALGSVHSLLVHSHCPPRGALLQPYAQGVPKPDVIIHLDPPVQLAVARTLQRPDPPLRWQGSEALERFVRHAHSVFQDLGALEAFDGRWYRISPVHGTRAELEALTDEIVEVILARKVV